MKGIQINIQQIEEEASQSDFNDSADISDDEFRPKDQLGIIKEAAHMYRKKSKFDDSLNQHRSKKVSNQALKNHKFCMKKLPEEPLVVLNPANFKPYSDNE